MAEQITTLRLPVALMERCEQVAARRRRETGKNVTRSEIAREALELGLKRLESTQ